MAEIDALRNVSARLPLVMRLGCSVFFLLFGGFGVVFTEIEAAAAIVTEIEAATVIVVEVEAPFAGLALAGEIEISGVQLVQKLAVVVYFE